MTGVSVSRGAAATVRIAARSTGVVALAGMMLAGGLAFEAPPAGAVEGDGRPVIVTKSHQTGSTTSTVMPVTEPSDPLAGADLPELPPLDPALNPDSPEGRMVALVRHRVVGGIAALGALTKGDIVATDGPITAVPSAEGGVRVMFKDLTIRAFSATGTPVVMAVGDLVVDASNADTEGAVAYEVSVAGPIQLYQGGRKVGSISMDRLLAEGAIDPETPMLGRDAVTLENMRLDVDVDVGGPEPVFVTMGSLTGVSESDVDEDNTIGGLIDMTMTDLRIGRGNRNPTVRVAETKISSVYDAFPVAWLQVLDVMASATRLPSQEEILDLNGRLLRSTTLGLSEGSIETTGLEIFMNPDDSITVDRLFVETAVEELEGDEPASGRVDVALDGLRTKGADLEAAMDLGAMRLSMEGEGLDAEMLRVFLADITDLTSTIEMPVPGELPPPPPPGMEEKALGLFAALVRDMGIGEAEWTLSLAGLAVRAERQEVLALGSLTAEGGWTEDEAGLADFPSRVVTTDLRMVDEDGGVPVRIDSLEIDTLSEGVDLATLRTAIVVGMHAAAGTEPLEPTALQDVIDSMAMAGGHLDIALEGLRAGTRQAPQGGLDSAALRVEIDPAPAGVDVADGAVFFRMDGFDTGPMAAAALPADLVPGGAGFDLTMTNLPVPAMMRMQLDLVSLVEGMEPEFGEDQLMGLMMRHQPAFDLETVSLEAPAYGISGSGRLRTDPTSPFMVEGGVSLTVRGLDETLALVRERARVDPSMRQAVPVLVALRGLGRVEQPGMHIFDLVVSPEQGVLINDVPAAMLTMQGAEPPPGQMGPGQPEMPGQMGPAR